MQRSVPEGHGELHTVGGGGDPQTNKQTNSDQKLCRKQLELST